jgi:acetyl-CoA carboxylase biotin carboxyl carrier protein
MDRDRIEQLIGMLNDSKAAELEVRDGGQRIKLRRRAGANGEAVIAVESAADTPCDTVGSDDEREHRAEKTTVVTARLVGLFHRGNRPGDEALASVGDKVSEGQKIGTIEALRNFTEVISPVAGVVVEVIAEDGEAVQYGDGLLVIRPDV